MGCGPLHDWVRDENDKYNVCCQCGAIKGESE